VDAAQATLLHIHVHHFQPNGISGVAVLAESHISIHTWPEVGYAAMDVFMCGRRSTPVGSRSTSSCADRTPDQTTELRERGQAAVTRRSFPRARAPRA
jgi:S-adenosylmethionine decarboxylase